MVEVCLGGWVAVGGWCWPVGCGGRVGVVGRYWRGREGVGVAARGWCGTWLGVLTVEGRDRVWCTGVVAVS